MDAAPESIIVVIGHPIAGNPSQFALERALRELEMDWRVFSLDVDPADIGKALEGFAVSGICGVVVDATLGSAAGRWYREQADSELDSIDCFYRDPSLIGTAFPFIGANQQKTWLNEQIDDALANDRDHDSEASTRAVWFGEDLDGRVVDVNRFEPEPAYLLTEIDSLQSADLIAIGRGQARPIELQEEDWPENDGSTVVIDLSSQNFSGGHPELDTIEDLGYRVVSVIDQKTAMLSKCLQQWSNREPNDDVIRDAIEEYLGV